MGGRGVLESWATSLLYSCWEGAGVTAGLLWELQILLGFLSLLL